MPIMTDPVLVSALIDFGINTVRQIFTYMNTAIRCKEELAALKDTLMKIEPIVKEIQNIRHKDEASAVEIWFQKLNALLNNASETVQQCTISKWNLRSLRRTSKKIANFNTEIDKHLALSSLVHIFQNQESARKILVELRQMNERIEALASSSSSASTSQAAHAPIGTINSKKDDKPVTGTASGLSSLPKVQLIQVQRYGKASNDFTAGEHDELNLTAGEEVQIIYEEGDWFFVWKKRRGRDTEEGFVPKLFINSS